MKSFSLAGVLVLLCLVPTALLAADSHSEPDAVALKSITGREIGGHMRFLASDLMKGRDTASPETRVAAEYLSAHLFAAGAETMGDDGPGPRTYYRRFPLEIVTAHEQGTELTLILELNGSKRVVPCKLGTDFTLFPRGLTAGEVEAQVVFASHGRVDAGQKVDDYEGLDVKNRFVLIYEGEPERGGARPREGVARSRNIFGSFGKVEPARKNGALGVLLIQPPGVQSPPPRTAPNGPAPGFERPGMTLGHARESLPAIGLSDPIRDLLVGTLGLAADSKPALLGGGGVRVRFRFAATKETKYERNVLGFFPGSDAEKKKEIIIYSAHYDHVGVDEKGEIFNGSDDNASGTSSLLEIAEAFGQAPRPARSVAFLWVSGEEKGLLGSHWFADHLNLPDGHKIVADINLDMVSRNDPKKIGITPSPKHGDHNSLVPAAQAACQAEGMQVVFDADSYYFRTDSYSFASKGIPSIFFFAGVHADYHRPTDDVEKADFEKAARVARAAFRLGWQAAQAREAPKKIKAESNDKAEHAVTSK